jgi:hypothetical protein
MSYRSPLKFDADTDETLFDLFKSLFLLLLAVGALRTVNIETLLTASTTMRPIPDPTLVGTVVYATVTMVVLGTGVVLWGQRRHPDERVGRKTRLRVGGAAAVTLVGVAYGLHESTSLPVFPRELLIAVANGVVVMGLGTVGYTRRRGTAISLALPDRHHWTTVLATVVLAALIALGGTYGYMRTVGTIPAMRFDRAAMGGAWPGELLLYSVFMGVGFGLLFNGAIQTTLRDRLGTAGGVTAATAITGFPLLVGRTLAGSGSDLGTLSLAALLTVENFMLVVIAFALVQGAWVLSRRVGVGLTPNRGAGAVVLVTALVSLAAEEPPFVALTASWVVVAALATVQYERTRSVWVPIAVYASYELFAAMETVRFLLGGYL